MLRDRKGMSSSVSYPNPPNKPADYECCKRGCCPCIFDYYWDALGRWENTVRELGGDPDVVLAGMPKPESGASRS
jgi:hypothetical protein